MTNATEKENANRKRIFLIVGLLIVILIAGTVSYYFWQNSRLDLARWELQPPRVSVEHPSQGQMLHAGQFSYVSTVAGSKNPIQSLELWIDGQLVDIIESELEDGTQNMGRVFDFLVNPGAQTITVRAIDTTGSVGQSLPVSITGVENQHPDEVFVQIFYSPEMSLEQVGEEFQVDPGLIVDSNPEVFREGNPKEGPILIPVSPATEEGSEEKPAQPPSEANFASKASGKICYPSEKIPAMTAYFQNTKTKSVVSLSIAANQLTYSIPLFPGTYIAYAWLPDKSLGGSYSKAVPCGLDVSCTDHTPLPFTIQSGGVTTQGIDICDWYNQPSVPNPPQTPGGPAPSPSGQISIPPGIPMLPVDQLEPIGNANSLPFAIFLPTSLPAAPTNLKAGTKDCKVQLSWTSNSDEVTEYQVWYSSQNGLLYLMASLKPPQSLTMEHWYEFSPTSSGAVSIWVDAVNAIGSQSSNSASVSIPTNCAPIGDENLEFTTLEVETVPGYDRVYTYLSLEGIPEQRLPSDDSVFIQTEGGRGDISHSTSGDQKYILPIPKDEMLTVEGECWGWSGGELSQLSQFSEVISASQWDGSKGRLGNEQCSIGYEINANYSSGMTMETFSGKAGNIPAPFNVRVQRAPHANEGNDADDPWVYSWWFEREVYWQWKGNFKDITGFTILLNGTPMKTVPAKERMTTVLLSSACGNNKWTVIANGKSGKSSTSQPLAESMIKCSKYLKIVFGAMKWGKTCDHWPCHFDHYQCDTLETYFTLSVNNFARSFYGGSVFMPLACGKHNMEQIVYSPLQTVFVIPFPTTPGSANYGGIVNTAISAKFWDYDLVGSNDYLGAATFTLWWPNYDVGKKAIKDQGVWPYIQFWSGGDAYAKNYDSSSDPSYTDSNFRFDAYVIPYP